MATQAQIDANRRNAKNSTGPRTVNGKRVVCNNALKHGLCSEDAVIPGEDGELFAEFADRLRLSLEENDYSLENVLLVERIILVRWKLRRLPRLERLAMDKLVAEHGDGDAALLAGIVGDASTATLAKLQQYEMRLNRELRSCMNEFRREYRSRSERDCHKAYCDGYNEGARSEAEYRHGATTPPLKEPPPQTLEAVDVPILDDPDAEAASTNARECPLGGELAEQSQFAANGWPEQELQDGEVVDEQSGDAGFPLPAYREQNKEAAA